ncbi:uncharacterized protein SPSK_01793 [Sporothrix schenckii 1099-18]|uniref:Uncharacterized protein n=1 Tax=Sporothrix schenckii 1099-18 TaxID=1397361 RepID=A0A0F2MEG2_SPOSC|nr:uncharacterized protein SPSK_01793 [Sporothrix schenckii 1099-18]KJR87250.1 hypothetical protein SPSK_01793 [Sporothrix schenckii 1099-18]
MEEETDMNSWEDGQSSGEPPLLSQAREQLEKTEAYYAAIESVLQSTRIPCPGRRARKADARQKECIDKLLTVALEWGHEVIVVNKWYLSSPRVCQDLRALAKRYYLDEIRPLLNGLLYQDHKSTEPHCKTRLCTGLEARHLVAIRRYMNGTIEIPMIASIDDLPLSDQIYYEMNSSGFLQKSSHKRLIESKAAKHRLKCAKDALNSVITSLRLESQNKVLIHMAETFEARKEVDELKWLKHRWDRMPLCEYSVTPIRYGTKGPWHMAIVNARDNIIILHISESTESVPQMFLGLPGSQVYHVRPAVSASSIGGVIHYMTFFISAPDQFIANLKENRSPEFGITVRGVFSEADGVSLISESDLAKYLLGKTGDW